MTSPIPGVPVSTPYGKRGSYWSCNEDSSGNGVHTGVDFACASGTDVVAPIPGQIRHRNYGSSFGNHQFAISPDPGDPFGDGEVFFAHMTSRPADGSWVQIGDYLGNVGAEGNVSGPHLHMEYHADTKGTWSCSVHDNPQPVLDYQATPPPPTNPTNPNNVQPGQKVVVTAEGSLNGRSGPSGDAPVVTSKPKGATFIVGEVRDGWAQDAASSSVKTAEKVAVPTVSGEPLVPVYDTDYLLGWDVSSNNSASWEPKPEEDFGWVKATEGKSYVNPDYAEQLRKGRDAGNVVGHYHWLNDGSVADQVGWFVANADVRDGEMIAVDWEDSSNPTTAQKDDAIRRLQSIYPNNRVGLYCNKDWWINHDTSSFYGDYLWIANYTSADDPGIEAEWLFWQFTSTPMDQNRGRFADLAALKAWAGGGGVPPEPPEPSSGVWYSTDYLDQYEAPPEPTKPTWSSKPTIILPMTDVPGSLSYIQDVAKVNGVTTDDGEVYDPCWIVAQDYNNAGDIRFLKFYENGEFQSWFQVNDAGHGSTFHAYRSAAGNLYVWCGEDAAYRHSWQSGKKVSKTSGDKMDYKGARPMGGYGADRVAFRNATDTKETFSIFDRTDFTDGTNRTKPIKEVTISKQTARTQQCWAATESRIYRYSGATNDNPPHGTKLHVLEVFDWTGARLLELDVTAMSIETTSDEPEGITFTGNPGSVMLSKREGASDPNKRSVPIWTMEGMP